jgi:UDP-N-acetylglucosamine 2-epimerase
MLGTSNNVFVVGETNIDNFNRIPLWSRAEIARSLGINPSKKWVLCTYHSETVLSLEENVDRVNALSKLFCEDLKDYEIVITKSSADY